MSEMKPIFKEGEKEHIILVYDKSTINDNDYLHDFWLKADEHVLKKKTQGCLQMTVRLHLPTIWEFGSD